MFYRVIKHNFQPIRSRVISYLFYNSRFKTISFLHAEILYFIKKLHPQLNTTPKLWKMWYSLFLIHKVTTMFPIPILPFITNNTSGLQVWKTWLSVWINSFKSELSWICNKILHTSMTMCYEKKVACFHFHTFTFYFQMLWRIK